MYNRKEVEGREFITVSHMYLENQYGRQVIIFFSIEGKYSMEDFIWDKELGKTASRGEIIFKYAEKLQYWVDLEMVDKERNKKEYFTDNVRGGIKKN